MLIAETPYRHQVEEDIKPFRDVLLGLFFVTTGMLLNPRVIWEHPFIVLGFLIGPILLKAVMITGLARLFGATPGVAMRTGLDLAQAGEFGFVLLNLILDKHLVDADAAAGDPRRDAAFDAGRAVHHPERRPHRAAAVIDGMDACSRCR